MNFFVHRFIKRLQNLASRIRARKLNGDMASNLIKNGRTSVYFNPVILKNIHSNLKLIGLVPYHFT